MFKANVVTQIYVFKVYSPWSDREIVDSVEAESENRAFEEIKNKYSEQHLIKLLEIRKKEGVNENG